MVQMSATLAHSLRAQPCLGNGTLSRLHERVLGETIILISLTPTIRCRMPLIFMQHFHAALKNKMELNVFASGTAAEMWCKFSLKELPQKCQIIELKKTMLSQATCFSYFGTRECSGVCCVVPRYSFFSISNKASSVDCKGKMGQCRKTCFAISSSVSEQKWLHWCDLPPMWKDRTRIRFAPVWPCKD